VETDGLKSYSVIAGDHYFKVKTRNVGH